MPYHGVETIRHAMANVVGDDIMYAILWRDERRK